jgi:hypothetical protein
VLCAVAMITCGNFSWSWQILPRNNMVLLVHSRKRHRLKDMGLGLNLGLLLCTCYQSEKFLIRRFRYFFTMQINDNVSSQCCWNIMWKGPSTVNNNLNIGRYDSKSNGLLVCSFWFLLVWIWLFFLRSHELLFFFWFGKAVEFVTTYTALTMCPALLKYFTSMKSQLKSMKNLKHCHHFIDKECEA